MKNKLTIAITAVAVIFGMAFGKAIVKGLFPKGGSVSNIEALVESSKQINASLPMQVDAGTRLDSTMAGPGSRFTYMYTLVNNTSSELNSVDFINAMKPNLINGYKTNPAMAVYRKNDVELHYYYRDKNGSIVAKIVISPKDF